MENYCQTARRVASSPYLELQFYGADILNSFRLSHYPAIRAALAAMLTQRAKLEAGRAED